MSDSVIPVRVQTLTLDRILNVDRWAVVEGRADGTEWQTVISARLARFMGVKPFRFRGGGSSGFPHVKRSAVAAVVVEIVDFAHSPRPLIVRIDGAVAAAKGAEVILGRDYLEPIRIPFYAELRWSSDPATTQGRQHRAADLRRVGVAVQRMAGQIREHLGPSKP